jgi:hypothetical protein
MGKLFKCLAYPFISLWKCISCREDEDVVDKNRRESISSVNAIGVELPKSYIGRENGQYYNKRFQEPSENTNKWPIKKPIGAHSGDETRNQAQRKHGK